jgi:Family of unknown function (DUF6527)
MKARPVKLVEGEYLDCEPIEATHLKLRLPGPIPERLIPVMIEGRREGTPNWTWNGSTESPTLRPSILTQTYRGDEVKHICHSFVTDGKVQFLSDCSHKYAGETHELNNLQ